MEQFCILMRDGQINKSSARSEPNKPIVETVYFEVCPRQQINGSPKETAYKTLPKLSMEQSIVVHYTQELENIRTKTPYLIMFSDSTSRICLRGPL